MKVKRRNGTYSSVSFDAILERILRLNPPSDLDVDRVVIQTISGMYDGITTSELDQLSARICANMQHENFQYDSLAASIISSDLFKRVRYLLASHGFESPTFSNKVRYLVEHGDIKYDSGFLEMVYAHSDALDEMIVCDRNDTYSYFALKTLERSYLLRSLKDDLCIESPQDMWMRVAVALNITSDGVLDLERVRQCYNSMSLGRYTHATPTLFNAGMMNQQCSSCYLMGTTDSMDGIWGTLKNAAMISKWAGGIGVHISNVRAKGARIKSTNGSSDGIVPMLQCYNSMVRYCNQAGRRKGSMAAYLEPWHADVWEFVELRRNTGAETERARDIFLALWIPDEFMKRVETDDIWYLMSPDECPGLIDAVGEEFTTLYTQYITENRYIRSLPARHLWQHIITCQLETGTPYVLFKDHVNRKCNQSNLGTIRSSNLCAEITEYSDSDSYAVCNLASIAVSSFVVKGDFGNMIDHAALHACAAEVTENLNNVIDISMYPVPETYESNMKMRPIGIGIQGMGDVYCMLGLAYDDPLAVDLDAEIMETIYHGAMEASVALAEKHGAYAGFDGSPLSNGFFQFDLWDRTDACSGMYDWEILRERVVRVGARNSLLTALMPTASTSHIMGNSECFEPFQSNVFKRNTLAGEFVVVNPHLMRALMAEGLWTPEVRNRLMAADGSVQKMDDVIPERIRSIFRTVWELPQRSIIDHAHARGPFVCQSQSMNLYMAQPSFTRVSSALLYAWKKGLKTGMYYLRTRAAVEAPRVGSAATPFSDSRTVRGEGGERVCDGDVCTMCSS